MIIQNRDIEILKFISKFGYVNSLHISKMFSLTQPRTSRVLSRLVKSEYLKKEQILAKQPSIYSLKEKGASVISSTRTKPIKLAPLTHNLLLIDLYIDLKLESPDTEILSDRDQRKGKPFGSKGHIPDLLIITAEQNGKKNIAIELELSAKSIKITKTILSRAERQGKYIEVHYYCNGSTYNHITKLTKFAKLFKVYDYFIDEVQPISDIIEDIKTQDVSKSRNLEILIRKQTNEISSLSNRVTKEEAKLQNIRDNFEKLEFKKSTFVNTHSISSDELTIFKKLISGIK